MGIELPLYGPVSKLVLKTFRMVTTRRTSGTEEPETPDLRDVIDSEVTETLHQILPGLFAQMKDELLLAVDQRIEAAFTTRESATGSNNQAQSRTVTFKDFMACQPPHFEGQKDPIACSRWIAAVEGAFRTSGCPARSKVFFAANLPPHVNVNTLEMMSIDQSWGPLAVHRAKG